MGRQAKSVRQFVPSHAFPSQPNSPMALEANEFDGPAKVSSLVAPSFRRQLKKPKREKGVSNACRRLVTIGRKLKKKVVSFFLWVISYFTHLLDFTEVFSKSEPPPRPQLGDGRSAQGTAPSQTSAKRHAKKHSYQQRKRNRAEKGDSDSHRLNASCSREEEEPKMTVRGKVTIGAPSDGKRVVDASGVLQGMLGPTVGRQSPRKGREESSEKAGLQLPRGLQEGRDEALAEGDEQAEQVDSGDAQLKEKSGSAASTSSSVTGTEQRIQETEIGAKETAEQLGKEKGEDRGDDKTSLTEGTCTPSKDALGSESAVQLDIFLPHKPITRWNRKRPVDYHRTQKAERSSLKTEQAALSVHGARGARDDSSCHPPPAKGKRESSVEKRFAESDGTKGEQNDDSTGKQKSGKRQGRRFTFVKSNFEGEGKAAERGLSPSEKGQRTPSPGRVPFSAVPIRGRPGRRERTFSGRFPAFGEDGEHMKNEGTEQPTQGTETPPRHVKSSPRFSEENKTKPSTVSSLRFSGAFPLSHSSSTSYPVAGADTKNHFPKNALPTHTEDGWRVVTARKTRKGDVPYPERMPKASSDTEKHAKASSHSSRSRTSREREEKDTSSERQRGRPVLETEKDPRSSAQLLNTDKEFPKLPETLPLSRPPSSRRCVLVAAALPVSAVEETTAKSGAERHRKSNTRKLKRTEMDKSVPPPSSPSISVSSSLAVAASTGAAVPRRWIDLMSDDGEDGCSWKKGEETSRPALCGSSINTKERLACTTSNVQKIPEIKDQKSGVFQEQNKHHGKPPKHAFFKDSEHALSSSPKSSSPVSSPPTSSAFCSFSSFSSSSSSSSLSSSSSSSSSSSDSSFSSPSLSVPFCSLSGSRVGGEATATVRETQGLCGEALESVTSSCLRSKFAPHYGPDSHDNGEQDTKVGEQPEGTGENEQANADLSAASEAANLCWPSLGASMGMPKARVASHRRPAAKSRLGFLFETFAAGSRPLRHERLPLSQASHREAKGRPSSVVFPGSSSSSGRLSQDSPLWNASQCPRSERETGEAVWQVEGDRRRNTRAPVSASRQRATGSHPETETNWKSFHKLPRGTSSEAAFSQGSSDPRVYLDTPGFPAFSELSRVNTGQPPKRSPTTFSSPHFSCAYPSRGRKRRAGSASVATSGDCYSSDPLQGPMMSDLPWEPSPPFPFRIPRFSNRRGGNPFESYAPANIPPPPSVPPPPPPDHLAFFAPPGTYASSLYYTQMLGGQANSLFLESGQAVDPLSMHAIDHAEESNAGKNLTDRSDFYQIARQQEVMLQHLRPLAISHHSTYPLYYSHLQARTAPDTGIVYFLQNEGNSDGKEDEAEKKGENNEGEYGQEPEEKRAMSGTVEREVPVCGEVIPAGHRDEVEIHGTTCNSYNGAGCHTLLGFAMTDENANNNSNPTEDRLGNRNDRYDVKNTSRDGKSVPSSAPDHPDTTEQTVSPTNENHYRNTGSSGNSANPESKSKQDTNAGKANFHTRKEATDKETNSKICTLIPNGSADPEKEESNGNATDQEATRQKNMNLECGFADSSNSSPCKPLDGDSMETTNACTPENVSLAKKNAEHDVTYLKNGALNYGGLPSGEAGVSDSLHLSTGAATENIDVNLSPLQTGEDVAEEERDKDHPGEAAQRKVELEGSDNRNKGCLRESHRPTEAVKERAEKEGEEDTSLRGTNSKASLASKNRREAQTVRPMAPPPQTPSLSCFCRPMAKHLEEEVRNAKQGKRCISKAGDTDPPEKDEDERPDAVAGKKRHIDGVAPANGGDVLLFREKNRDGERYSDEERMRRLSRFHATGKLGEGKDGALVASKKGMSLSEQQDAGCHSPEKAHLDVRELAGTQGGYGGLVAPDTCLTPLSGFLSSSFPLKKGASIAKGHRKSRLPFGTTGQAVYRPKETRDEKDEKAKNPEEVHVLQDGGTGDALVYHLYDPATCTWIEIVGKQRVRP